MSGYDLTVRTVRTFSILAFVALQMFDVCYSLNAYGHAFSRPSDFTPAEYAQIARFFPIFTVEKDHAQAVYGNATASAPFNTNSYAATVGTAKKIKDLNESVRVLMYWNAALHYNFYECESEVQPQWLLSPQETYRKPPE